MRFLNALRELFSRRDGKPAPSKPVRQARRHRPRLEALEDRTVPTIWFVSTAGNDGFFPFIAANNPAVPFRSIQHAVDVASSGDSIFVAKGTYTAFDSPESAQIDQNLGLNTSVVTVWNKFLTILGGWNANFSSYSQTANPTVIDGQGAFRGVFAGGDAALRTDQFGFFYFTGLGANSFGQPDISAAQNRNVFPSSSGLPIGLVMSTFTIQNGLARPESHLGGVNEAHAFGGGMWLSTAAIVNTFAPIFGTATAEYIASVYSFYGVYDVNFNQNSAQGGPDVQNLLSGAGGTGAGGGAALSFVQNSLFALDNFNSNHAKGFDGAANGAVGDGGGMFLDNSTLTATIPVPNQSPVVINSFQLNFRSNTAQGGNATGANQTSAGASGGQGGGLMVATGSTARVDGLTATGNVASGGNAPNGIGGSGFGGGVQVEATLQVRSFLVLTNPDIENNIAVGGNGNPGGQAGGGGLSTFFGTMTLNGGKVNNNHAISGNGANGAGPVSGGGIQLTAFGLPIDPTTHQPSLIGNTINRTTIQGNTLQLGSSGIGSLGAGGAGVFLQGVSATFQSVTVNNNNYAAGTQSLLVGQGILLTTSTDAGNAATIATTATIKDSTIENHVNQLGGQPAAALHVRPGTTVNLHNDTFTGNSIDTNNGNGSLDPSGGFGTFNFI